MHKKFCDQSKYYQVERDTPEDLIGILLDTNYPDFSTPKKSYSSSSSSSNKRGSRPISSTMLDSQ